MKSQNECHANQNYCVNSHFFFSNYLLQNITPYLVQAIKAKNTD